MLKVFCSILSHSPHRACPYASRRCFHRHKGYMQGLMVVQCQVILPNLPYPNRSLRLVDPLFFSLLSIIWSYMNSSANICTTLHAIPQIVRCFPFVHGAGPPDPTLSLRVIYTYIQTMEEAETRESLLDLYLRGNDPRNQN